jgi:hypothetical protein
VVAPPTGSSIPDEAYLDPVLKEDVRNDTDCIVVIAVAVDPPLPAASPVKPGSPAATGAPVIPVVSH